MKFEWFVALRYLKRRGNFFLSIVTLIAILGVAVGVMTVTVVLAVMNGFDKELEEKITRNLSPLIVERYGGLKNYNEIIAQLEKMERVKSATPFVQGQGLLRYGERIYGLSIIGVDTSTYTIEGIKFGMNDLGEKVRFENGKRVEVSGIILGTELAHRLEVTVGARVKCISGALSKNSGTLSPSLVEYEVRGIFASGMYEIDNSLGYISLSSAQELFRTGDSVSGIEVRPDDIYVAGELARKIETVLGPSFVATSWMERHKNLFSALRLEKTTMFVILTMIILVAAFNITGILIMVVMEKTKDIGILKSIGASNCGIMGIFVLEGILIGLSGVLVGAGAGFALCSLLEKYPVIQLPQEIYFLNRLPVEMNAGDFVSIGAFAFLVSLIATLYPAWRAAHLHPAEALRYE